MELGWPLSKRRQFLKEQTAENSARTHPLRFQNRQQYFPVYTVPIGLPLYRLENGRTTGRQREYLASRPELSEDFFRADDESVMAQKAQHGILVKLTRERKNLFKEFETQPQTEPIILTSNGYVVNGNRRLSTWRELLESDRKKFDRFKSIDVIILPHADEKDIDQLEAELQLKEDLKADYPWTSTALMIREKMSRYGYKDEDLSVIYGKDKKEITEILDCLDYADQYLASRETDSKYSDVEGKEYAFIQISRTRRKLKGTEEQKEIFEKAAFCLADEAGEGRRIYAEIPKIADHLDAVISSLAEEFDVDGAGGVEAQLSCVLDDKANFESARLTIRDTIEAASRQKKDKLKKDYVVLQITRARDNLREAKASIDDQSTKDGAKSALEEIEALILDLKAWAAADG